MYKLLKKGTVVRFIKEPKEIWIIIDILIGGYILEQRDTKITRRCLNRDIEALKTRENTYNFNEICPECSTKWHKCKSLNSRDFWYDCLKCGKTGETIIENIIANVPPLITSRNESDDDLILEFEKLLKFSGMKV